MYLQKQLRQRESNSYAKTLPLSSSCTPAPALKKKKKDSVAQRKDPGLLSSNSSDVSNIANAFKHLCEEYLSIVQFYVRL